LSLQLTRTMSISGRGLGCCVVKAGAEVAYCIVTDGDAGGSDRTISRQDMAKLRQQEQRAAASEVGVSTVTFLGYPDGRLTSSIELRRDITRAVREFRPDRLVCQSPERYWERIGASHPTTWRPVRLQSVLPIPMRAIPLPTLNY